MSKKCKSPEYIAACHEFRFNPDGANADYAYASARGKADQKVEELAFNFEDRQYWAYCWAAFRGKMSDMRTEINSGKFAVA